MANNDFNQAALGVVKSMPSFSTDGVAPSTTPGIGG